MAIVLVCKIGSTFYNKASGSYPVAGNGALVSVQVDPGGHGTVGSAQISLLRETGGAYTITSRMRVQIALVNDTTGVATKALFDGYVSNVESHRVMGTTVWQATVDCVDVNVQLDSLYAAASQAVVSFAGATTFGDMILQLARHVTLHSTVGTPTFEATAGNALASSTGLTAPTGMRGLSLRDCLQVLCDELNRVFPAVLPRFYFKPTASLSPGVYVGKPELVIIDGSLANLAAGLVAASYQFADDGTACTMLSFTRNRDAADQQTRVELVSRQGTTGDFYKYGVGLSTAPHRVTYSNDLDARVISATTQNAWQAALIKVEDNVSQIALTNRAAEILSDVEWPLETIDFDTDDPNAAMLVPGDKIEISFAHEGLATVRYWVAGAPYSWQNRSGVETLIQSVTAGNQKPELGEGIAGGRGRVVEGDVIGPEPPVLSSTVVWRPSRTRTMYGRITWTASPSSDRYQYRIYRGIGGIVIETFVVPASVLTVEVGYDPGQSYSIFVTCIDGRGNEGVASNTITGSVPAAIPADRLYNGDFSVLSYSDITQPDGWTRTPVGAGTGAVDSVAATGKELAGLNSLRLEVGGTGDSVEYLSDPVWIGNPVAGTMSRQSNAYGLMLHQATNTSGTLQAEIRYYDSAGAQLSGTATLYNAAPVIGSPQRAEVIKGHVPPPGTLTMRLWFKLEGLTFSNEVWVGGCELKPAVSGAQTNAQLDLASEVTIAGGGSLAVDAETSSFDLTEDDGTVAGTFTYDPGDTEVSLFSEGTRTLLVGGGGGGSLTFGSTGNITYSVPFIGTHTFTQGDVLLHDAALVQSAGTGFPFIPTMPGPPSVAAPLQAGLAPLVVDDVNGLLGYAIGASWKWLGGTATGATFEPLVFNGEIVFFDGEIVYAT